MLKAINPHFEDFLFDWNHKHYLLVGGYGSGKSYQAALKLVMRLLTERRTALVVREVFETIRDSCFSQLREIITELGADEVTRVTVSPMQIRFVNGSKIIFKGMDKPAKLKSVNDVSIVWAEECSEMKYAGFKELLGRVRHPSLPLHFLLSTNPVDKSSWVYKHFFEDEEAGTRILSDEELYTRRIVSLNGTYYHHSVADDNYFLPDGYITELDRMAAYDPDMHRVAREGRFGWHGTRVLPQFSTAPHADVMCAVERCTLKRVGMDFGFEESYNALVRVAVDEEEKTLLIYWEYYKNKTTDDITAGEIATFKRTRELIYADSAEPKTIRYYNQQGFRMKGAKKFPGSRLANIRKVKRFRRIVCSENCPHTIRELQHLTYAKDRKDVLIPDVFNIDPHTFSAIWYALDGYEVADLKDRKNYSGKGART